MNRQTEFDKRTEEQSKNSVSLQHFDEHNKEMREYSETVCHNAKLSSQNTKLEM